jgi:hypothetical protein
LTASLRIGASRLHLRRGGRVGLRGVESLGQKGAATWLTKGVKMLDAAQTDAPAATEVQS